MATGRMPRKGDIWHVNPNPVAGRELEDGHYYLVITEEALNRALGVALCCPISTAALGARSAGVTVSVQPQDTASNQLRGVVLCHQLRAIDLHARGAVFRTLAEPVLLDEVVMKLVDLIDPQ
ncbi:growth inhibitor PemK [Nissabacter sp. SGAir0207]|nr:growth inhibitor PemK [Nissabacter sp. SGAir0207]